MTERKFTDEEVLAVLACCSNLSCVDYCPLKGTDHCESKKSKAAYDLINRQRAEIDDLTRDTIPKLKYGLERANKYGAELEKSLANARAEAIKEFAERLKEQTADIILYGEIVPVARIDRLVKEMTEGKPCTEDADCSTEEGEG